MDLRKTINDLAKSKPAPVLDSACGDKKNEKMMLDSASIDDATTKLSVAASVQQWVESCENIEDGETCADLLLAMLIGIVDMDKDGELSEDEQDAMDDVLEFAWDYLSRKGASDEDIGALLNDWDADAGMRIRDLLAAELPDGEEADSDMDDFAFEDNSSIFDAAYKKVTAIRGGKKVRINKRISGVVKLSARQKMAIRKAAMKAHGGQAKMRRRKSMALRKKMNM